MQQQLCPCCGGERQIVHVQGLLCRSLLTKPCAACLRTGCGLSKLVCRAYQPAYSSDTPNGLKPPYCV